jgi:hypothetical protein
VIDGQDATPRESQAGKTSERQNLLPAGHRPHPWYAIRDKNFLFGGTGRVSIFVPIYSSKHRENYKLLLKKMSRRAESVGYVSEAVQGAQRAGNYVDISLWEKKRIMKYIRPRSQPP